MNPSRSDTVPLRGTDDFFRARLNQMIDLRHPLAVFATRMPWDETETPLAPDVAHKDRGGRVVQRADLSGIRLQRAGAGGRNAAGLPQAVQWRPMNAYLFTQLVLALLSGVALRKLRSRSGASITAEAQRAVARLAWILLAVFSVEAMTRGNMNPLYALFMLVYIVIVYMLARALATRDTETFQLIPVAATTFGGGNRGVALISALSALPVLAPNREELLTVFVQLDAAVILWLVVVVPYLVSGATNAKPQIIDSYKAFVSEAGFAPVVMVLVVLFGSLVPQSVKTLLHEFLEQSSKERAAVLTYLAFTLMFATTSLAARSIGGLLDDLWRFYLPRLLIPTLLVLLLYAGLMPIAPLGGAAISLAVALSVLALSPPSSLFAVLLASSEGLSRHAPRLADLNVLTTILFLLLAIVAASPGPLLGFLRFVMGTGGA